MSNLLMHQTRTQRKRSTNKRSNNRKYAEPLYKTEAQHREEHETKRAKHPEGGKGPEEPQTSPPGGSTAAAR
jgi:hypothetical protein